MNAATLTPWLYYFLMVVLSVFGLALNLLGLPGLWLLIAGYATFGWATGWNHFVGWPSVITLLVLAALAELVEFFAGAAGSKAAGGRKRGMAGAVVGALIGGVAFSFLIPIPVVGTIVGACVGAFVGAALAEFYDRDWNHALRVGIGAAKGRFAGIVIKLGFGIVMFIIALIAGFPH